MSTGTTRQTKTPAQRAQEAVDVIDRRITRLTEKRDQAYDAAAAIDDEIVEQKRRLAYAEKNPDLHHPAISTTEEPA